MNTIALPLSSVRWYRALCTTLLLFFLLCACMTFAAQVPEHVARSVAYRFLTAQPVFTELRADGVQLVRTVGDAPFDGGTIVYFRVYDAAGQGFVVVAGDDAVTPVLAYSTERSFPQDELPSNVAKWFESYTAQIRAAVEVQAEAEEEVARAWQGLLGGEAAVDRESRDVTPLLQTLWDQAPNVNALCPSGSVTGCVATAMAQIMKYHGHPAQGAGFHSYNHPNYGTLSANFGATTYNWGGMPNTVSGTNNAVATLMYHCGVGVDMQYSPQVSNAYVLTNASPIQHCAEYAMRTYFDYHQDMQGVHRDSYSEAQWITLLKGELDAERPILYAGFGTGGGHAFVCDGYDNSNFFHFNWGWGGQANGYFQVSALNPGSTGTGGGSGGYNSGQQALIGIRPASGGGSPQTDDMALYTYVSPSASTIYYGQAFSVSTNIVNNGTNGFSGDYCAAVFDNANNFYGYVQTLTGYTLPAGNAYTNNLVFSTTGLFSMVPGTYRIGIFQRPSGGEWVLVADNGAFTNFPQITVINPNAMELNAALTVSPGMTVIQGAPLSVNTNIINTGFDTFYGQYGVALYNLDGTWAQDIGTLNESNGLPYDYTYLAPYLTFGPANVTVQPGTYLLALQHNPNNTGWQLTGSSNFTNPVFVTITAAGLSPDQYEANNAISQAASLAVNFAGNTASVNTTGSNLHTGTDQDHYRIVLPAGNNYAISARLHDSYNSSNGNTYSVDAMFSYSTNGTSWSSVYDDVMPGEIIVSGGGTVYFHVAPYFAGEMGTYLLQLDIERGADVGVDETALNNIAVFPNPANDRLTIDLGLFSGTLEQVELLGLNGQVVQRPAMAQRTGGRTDLDLTDLSEGAYVLRLITDKGVRNERILVVR